MFGTRLIATAPDNIVTVFDFTNCYAAPPVVQPCERVAYRAGLLNVAFNVWCGLLLIAVAAWLLWELWSAVAPKPITDDFLKLLDDSFGRNWRSPRTWPWARMGWAYGFTLVGAASALGRRAVPFDCDLVIRIREGAGSSRRNVAAFPASALAASRETFGEKL